MNKKLYIIEFYGENFMSDYIWSRTENPETAIKEYQEGDMLDGYSDFKAYPVNEAVNKQDLINTITRQLIKPLNK